jgi:hypothetical protein
MKFEVINDKNIPVMSTIYASCIPSSDAISSMSKAGYRFRLDGKIMSVKKLNEQIKEFKNEQSN